MTHWYRHSKRFAEICIASLASTRLVPYQICKQEGDSIRNLLAPGVLSPLSPATPVGGRLLPPRGPAASAPARGTTALTHGRGALRIQRASEAPIAEQNRWRFRLWPMMISFPPHLRACRRNSATVYLPIWSAPQDGSRTQYGIPRTAPARS